MIKTRTAWLPLGSLPCLAVWLATALAVPGLALADERVEHFSGKPAETLEQAVGNFSEYNRKLEELLDGELSPQEMGQVHELTYTLENALEKINADLAALADTLEEVHIASETQDVEGVRQHGEVYLTESRKIID